MSALAAARPGARNPGLEQLQAGFANAVLESDGGFLSAIRETPGFEAPARLGIYFDAYRARLAEALQDSFAHTARLLGEAAFLALAREYIEANPSRHYNVRWYGDAFPAWVRDARPAHGELAAFDWALRTAFDSADAEALGPADLAALSAEDWERAGFVLHPSFQLLELAFNSVPVWQALDRDETPPAFRPLAVPVTMLVWRRDLQPHFRSLEPDEAKALRAALGGASFAEVCLQAAEQGGADDAVVRSGRWLRRWIDEALLAGIRR
ncbi:MAG: DNA-binding domain-containing protein [Proteobacteria bacterium]|nr:DNA-binding domain-containing protein [Pseudomonadota bacterium]